MWITLLRWGSTAIAAVALALSYLNIEKLAEKHGWDQILVKMEEGVPDLPSWLWPALFLFSSGAALALWANKLLSKREQSKTTSKAQSEIVPTSPATIQDGLYVCDIRFTFSELEKDRHSDLTMRVFNGTGSVVEFFKVRGQVKFEAPNTTDPDRMGTLPTPGLHHDTEKTVAPFKEWFLMMTQRVPAIEADKLQAMLEAGIRISFDLRELIIEVVWQHDRNKVEQLPIWGGVSYSRGYGFGRIGYGDINIRI